MMVITRNARQSRHSQQAPSTYAAFFCALTFAHLARCAAAIFLRPAADMVRLGFILPVCFGALFAHRAFCAKLIRRRAEADRVRLGFWLETPPQGSHQKRPTVVTSKPANESGLGLGCFTPSPPEKASLFSCANSVGRI